MLLLARCLDWICRAFASGAQDAMRLNQLICPLAAQRHQNDGAARRP
ncbi:hypothetical protein SAMN05518849_12440 [Sphingobium sp. AP50]|nr:hypothetical protein SAMN05518849_12440 [Sphingobium sp. AP50]